MRILQLNHVGLFVGDLERSVAFYGGVLGLERKARPEFGDRGAWFAVGAAQELHLIERAPRPEDRGEPRTHFALVVDNADAALARLAAAGVPIDSQSRRPDGAAQILVRDPDGHAIELTCDLP